MFNLASFHERLRRLGTPTSHRIYRVALAACVGMIILGGVASSRADTRTPKSGTPLVTVPNRAEQGLPTSDTPYGAAPKRTEQGLPTRDTSPPKAGAAPVQIGPQLDPKQCGAIKERYATLARQLAEFDKGQNALIETTKAYEAQMRSLRCVDVRDLVEPEKYKQCDQIRKARMAVLRKIPLRNAEITNIHSERDKLSGFLTECRNREIAQAQREGRPVKPDDSSISSPSNVDSGKLTPSRTTSVDDIDLPCEFFYGWIVAASIFCR